MWNMRRIATFFICVLCGLFCFAQERTSTVTIAINNESGTPVEGLTAELLSAKDSELRKNSSIGPKRSNTV